MTKKKESGPAANEATINETNNCSEYIAGLKRRRASAQRLPRLDCCGTPDPWTHRRQERITEHYIDGYKATAEHLLANGLTPSPNLHCLRAMWRRGGHDQRIAMRIAELWETPAA